MYSPLGPHRRQIGLQELQQPTDRRERRADLVGDARGHAAEEGELIGAPDLLPDALLLGGVPEEQDERRGVGPPFPALDRHLEESDAAVAPSSPPPRSAMRAARRPRPRGAAPDAHCLARAGRRPRATGSARRGSARAARPSRVSAVALNDTRSPAGQDAAACPRAAGRGCRCRGRTGPSDSVSRPTAASSAPSSSVTVSRGPRRAAAWRERLRLLDDAANAAGEGQPHEEPRHRRQRPRRARPR